MGAVMKRHLSLNILCLYMLTTGAATVAGQSPDGLDAAKGFYASAEYDRALAALERMDPSAIGPEQARDRLLYQALCLLALENKPGAEAKLTEVLQAHPLFVPGAEIPPRLHTLLDDVRTRLRPALAQEHYRTGKERFEAGDYASALAEFALVIELAEGDEAQRNSALTDIRLLAEGFRDLSRRALEPPPAPPVRDPEPAVTPPVAIRQDMPPWPSSASYTYHTGVLENGPLIGVLQIVVGQTGQVVTVTLVDRIHPAYDNLLVSAAKQWIYEPALLNGRPIEFVKRLNVRISPR